MTVYKNDAAAASALLSAPALRSAMSSGRESELAQRIVSQLVDSGFADGAQTIRTVVWRCHRWLSRYHRNDLVYRNAIIEQSAPKGPGVILPEFRIGGSIADFLKVEESLHVLEIKSDVDNVTRLERQIDEYEKIAPLVSLVLSPRLVDYVVNVSRFDRVGLQVLSRHGEIQCVRRAQFSGGSLDSGFMMRSIRRSEYLNVLKELGHPVPELPNTQEFSCALDLSMRVDPFLYHEAVVEVLKKRKLKAGRSRIARLPGPLRPSVLKLNPTGRQIDSLREWLNMEVENVYA